MTSDEMIIRDGGEWVHRRRRLKWPTRDYVVRQIVRMPTDAGEDFNGERTHEGPQR